MMTAKTLLLLVACLVSTATLISATEDTVEAQGLSGLPPLTTPLALRLSEFGSAHKDPCDSTWSNDEQTERPCPTASPTFAPTSAPTVAPTIDWSAASTLSKSHLCTDQQSSVAEDSTELMETTVGYYYTVETAPEGDPQDFLPKLENALLNGVARDVFLPCDDQSELKKNGNLRKTIKPNLQSDVAIDSISSKPVDTELIQCKSSSSFVNY